MSSNISTGSASKGCRVHPHEFLTASSSSAGCSCPGWSCGRGLPKARPSASSWTAPAWCGWRCRAGSRKAKGFAAALLAGEEGSAAGRASSVFTVPGLRSVIRWACRHGGSGTPRAVPRSAGRGARPRARRGTRRPAPHRARRVRVLRALDERCPERCPECTVDAGNETDIRGVSRHASSAAPPTPNELRIDGVDHWPRSAQKHKRKGNAKSSIRAGQMDQNGARSMG